MADEKKLGFGEKADSKAKDARSGDEGGPNAPAAAVVSEEESAALQGTAGPNRVPAYGKKQMEDENHPIRDEVELQALKDGSSANSGPKEGSDLAKAVASRGVEETEGGKTYVSHIARLRIGQFQFEQGRLILKPEDSKKFEQLLETAHPRTRQSIHLVDADAGEAFAKKFRSQQTTLSRGVDTSEKATKSPEPSKS